MLALRRICTFLACLYLFLKEELSASRELCCLYPSLSTLETFLQLVIRQQLPWWLDGFPWSHLIPHPVLGPPPFQLC